MTSKQTGGAVTASPKAISGAELPATFDPGKLYDVQLHTAFTIGPVTMNPADAQTMRGDVCEEHRDKIWKATLNDWGVQDLSRTLPVDGDGAATGRA